MNVKKTGFWQNVKRNNQQNNTVTNREKLTLSIAGAALLVGTLFIFGPFKMYAGNSSELWFSFWDILPVLSIFSLGVFLILAALCYFLPVRFGRFLLALIFGLGMAFYIEGTFMPMDYGPLDGIPIDWSQYAGRIFFDNILWVLCILLTLLLLVLKSNLFIKLAPIVCASLIIAQGAELVIRLPKMAGWKINSDYLTDTGKFALGKKENIIVIVLDGFDHRMLERSISNSKELANSFKDFIDYENSMSDFNYTTPAIPSILTGINYDNSVPLSEYISSAYERFPLLETLFKAGYDSRLFTFQFLTPMNDKKIKTYIANKNKLDNRMRLKLTGIMGQFTLMRYSPVCLKNIIWLAYDSFEQVRSHNLGFSISEEYENIDLSFYKQLKREGVKLVEGKAFRFYHFKGVHVPINMNSNLNIIKGCLNDLAVLDQAEGVLKITAEFLKEIKNKGVYENSTIIILGDHGMLSDPTMAFYLGSIMLIKNKNANSPYMKKSSAPVINSDVAATVMGIISPENNFGGTAINRIDEKKARKRKYYFSNFLGGSTQKGYITDLLEFTNDSITIHPDDFSMTGNILSSTGIVKYTYKDYPLGKLINFEDVTYDWMQQIKEDKKIYGVRAVIGRKDLQPTDVIKTAGISSTLGFILSESGTDLVLTMVLASAFEKDNPQRLFIEVNGTRLQEEFVFTGRDFRTVKINIPERLIKEDKRLTLKLLTPDAKQRINPFEHMIYFKEALTIKSLVIEAANR